MRKYLVRGAVLLLVSLLLIFSANAAGQQVWHEAYLGGYPDGTIRPEAVITRAELAQVLYRMMDAGRRAELDTHDTCFLDVMPNHWAYRAVTAATELGVMYGFDDGTFHPDDGVSRTQLALILTRIVHVSAANGAMPELAARWQAQEISFTAENGWVMGYDGEKFVPDEPLTRAEFAQIFNRVLGRMPRSVDDLMVGMTLWSDNGDTAAWYFFDLQEAGCSHAAETCTDGERWTALG